MSMFPLTHSAMLCRRHSLFSAPLRARLDVVLLLYGWWVRTDSFACGSALPWARR